MTLSIECLRTDAIIWIFSIYPNMREWLEMDREANGWMDAKTSQILMYNHMLKQIRKDLPGIVQHLLLTMRIAGDDDSDDLNMVIK